MEPIDPLDHLFVSLSGEADLEVAKSALDGVLATIPSFIAIVKPDGRFLYLNRMAPGLAVEGLSEMRVFQFLPESAHATARETFARVVATRRGSSYSSSGTGPHGAVARYETTVGPIMGDGEVVALVLNATDVTAHSDTMDALEDSLERLRVAVQASGMGLWSWDAQTDAIEWDDRACDIFGVTEAPSDFEQYISLLHPEEREWVAATVQRALEQGEYEGFDHRAVRPDGDTRWLMARGAVIRDESGAVRKLIGGVLDITDRKALEERLVQSQKLEAVGQLTAGIAHNFNNMLAGILPNLELAAEIASPEVLELIEAATEAGVRAAGLVRQLMTFASPQRETQRRAQLIGPVITRTLDICRTTFDKSIEVRSSGLDAVPAVHVDVLQVEQALLNIALNARDALRETPSARIDVRVEVVEAPPKSVGELPPAPRGYVAISIRDNGPGIEPEAREHIFEPFFTTKPVGEGTGLGLSTTHAIVRESGGAIVSESRPGRGTKFVVYLPIAVEGEALHHPQVAPDRPRGNETILVVDDESLVRKAVQRMLESGGYTVLAAESGADALALMQGGGNPDLAILDLSMPGMDGSELRRHIAEINPQLPVMYFTGYAISALQDEVDAVLHKPVDRTRLLGAVREVLDRGS